MIITIDTDNKTVAIHGETPIMNMIDWLNDNFTHTWQEFKIVPPPHSCHTTNNNYYGPEEYDGLEN